MSITVILSCSSLSLTKPLFLDISLPLDQIFNQQAPGQEIQPQGNAFQSEESINQWDDVTSGMNLETQPQGDAFQPEDSLNQENDVTSGMDQDTQPQGDAFQPEKSIKQDNDVQVVWTHILTSHLRTIALPEMSVVHAFRILWESSISAGKHSSAM